MNASTTAARVKVSVSYAWKEELEGANTEAVERFCTLLREKGCEVIRDKDSVKPGQNLVAFMQSLAAADHICVFLTDAYLKSPDCMFELLTAWELSFRDSTTFAKRVHIWQMDGCPPFGTLEDREPLVEWWRQRAQTEKALAQRPDAPQIDPSTQRYLNKNDEIHRNLHALLTHCKDHLLPRNQEDLLVSLFPDGLPVGPPIEPLPNLSDVFQSVLNDIDKLLAADCAVASRLLGVQPDLFFSSAANVPIRISRASLNAGSLPQGRVREVFQAVEDDLQDWSPTPAQATLVLKICGQIVVLAMNPAWVILQRKLAEESHAQVPGTAAQIELGFDPGNTLSSRTVNFLHIVTVAIAGGGADLDTLFGDHAKDGRFVTPPPMKSGSIGEAAELLMLQRCLIRAVLGPAVTIPDGSTAQDQLKIKDLLQRARDVASHFLEKYRKPFYSLGSSWQGWQETFNRGRPELPQMVLLAQADGSPADAFPEYTNTLLSLYDIYQLLRQRTTQS